jgi:tetratricopeptide (TPR) repeat protein
VESTDSTSVSPSTEEPKSVAEQELDTRYESASAVLKQAGKKNDPSRIDAHFWVGQRYYRMKNYAKAAEHFSTVVEAGGNSPKRNTALFNLAMCYYEMHKGEPAELDQAKKTFQQVRDNFPNTPSAVQAAGWIETIEWLQRVEQEQRQKQQAVKEQTAPEDSGGQQESAAKIIKGKQH